MCAVIMHLMSWTCHAMLCNLGGWMGYYASLAELGQDLALHLSEYLVTSLHQVKDTSPIFG